MAGEVKEVDEWVDAEKSAAKNQENLRSPGQQKLQKVDAEDDHEEWMFKTFSRVSNKKPPQPPKVVPQEAPLPLETEADDFGENLQMPAAQASSGPINEAPSTQCFDSNDNHFGDPFMLDLINQYSATKQEDNYDTSAAMYSNFSEFEKMQ